jgi:chromate transporter
MPPVEGRRGPVGELVRLFGRLGVTAFGGPAAHIAMMHDEVVTRRAWVDDQRFLDLIGVTNLIPGPNSTEMTMHIGNERAGWRGLVAAGTAFILPASLIVLALAWAYVRYGTTPAGEWLLYGVKPVVVVVIVQALLKLGRAAVKDWLTAAVAVAAVGAYVAGVNELPLLGAGAVMVLAVRLPRSSPLLLLPGAGWLAAQAATGDPIGLGRLFVVFAKAGAFLYGSGYVLLAFLEGDLVDRLGVLSEGRLLDAVAIGQITPGPLSATATFIGYVLAGLPGAVVATVGIFLLSFFFVAAIGPLVRRIRERAWTEALLDGVNAAALGLMAGVTAVLAGDAAADLLAVGIGALAALVLWKTKLATAWLVVGGGAAGVVAGLVGAIGWGAI